VCPGGGDQAGKKAHRKGLTAESLSGPGGAGGPNKTSLRIRKPAPPDRKPLPAGCGISSIFHIEKSTRPDIIQSFHNSDFSIEGERYMKKLLQLLVSAAVIFSIVSCGDNKLAGETGVYQATVKGHNGPLSLEVEVNDGLIRDIRMLESSESEGIGDVAFDKITGQVLESQTLNVDTATGATISSWAVRNAIEEALEEAGADIDALYNKELKKDTESIVLDTDIVVLGSGAAGMSAAIEAARAGAEVVVLEKLSRNGGSSRTSSGMVLAGGSDFQNAAGIEDSPEALRQYWLNRAEGDADTDLIDYAASNALESLQFLVDMGISYTKDLILYSGTQATRRAHLPPGYGREFMDKIVETAEDLGVTVYTDTKAVSLIKEGSRITGVKALHNGADFTVNAGAVIIATGGFDHNEELKAKYAPDAAGAWAVSAPQNTGDGLLMGMEAGADTVFKGGVIGWKVVSPGYGHTTMIGRPLYGLPNLIVDSEGNRFTDESLDYPFIFNAMAENGSDKFYFIFDSDAGDTETLEASTGTRQSLDLAVEAKVAFKADSIEELAETAGLGSLAAAVEKFNTAFINGQDPEFDRDPATMEEISEGPFYALQCQTATLGTFGGLKVSVDGEVLDKTGAPIEGLYAAGEVANGDFFGSVYPASGSSLGMSVIFGRKTGMTAASCVK